VGEPFVVSCDGSLEEDFDGELDLAAGVGGGGDGAGGA
jgi:hypothetical protein